MFLCELKDMLSSARLGKVVFSGDLHGFCPASGQVEGKLSRLGTEVAKINHRKGFFKILRLAKSPPGVRDPYGRQAVRQAHRPEHSRGLGRPEPVEGSCESVWSGKWKRGVDG